MSSIANETQVGGDHYRTAFQHWDFMAESFGAAWFKGSITKYVSRHRKKNGLQDLQKARHYLVKLIELVEQEKLPLPLPWTFGDEFAEANKMESDDAAVFRQVVKASTLPELSVALTMLDILIKREGG